MLATFTITGRRITIGLLGALALMGLLMATVQLDADVRNNLRPVYAENAEVLIAYSQTVATHFATVSVANNYWRDPT